MMAAAPAGQAMSKSLVKTAAGTYVPTLVMDGEDVLLRLFNAEGDAKEQTVELGFVPSGASLVELDGRVISPVSIVPDAQQRSCAVKLPIPRFGVRTLKLSGSSWSLPTAQPSSPVPGVSIRIRSHGKDLAVNVSVSGMYKAELFSLNGQRIATLWDGRLTKGEHIIPLHNTLRKKGLFIVSLESDYKRFISRQIVGIQ
jgi:hypothetical protein